MKTRFMISLGIGLAMLTAPGVVRAAVANGSFESWNLQGWTFQSDSGSSATEPFSRTAGQARTMSTWGSGLGFNPSMLAADGGRFLTLNSRANANFLGNETYNFSVSQSFTLNPGERLSGLAAFFNGDNQPNDTAWVRVLDSEGHLIASLWDATSGPSVNLLALPSSTPAWNSWQWGTSAPGTFTLQLGMTTTGANNDASYGFFDGITISAQPIPEPSAMVLGILGSFALIVLRHRRN
ncbi:MAG: hypothetical protein QM813_21060 [Verrucomicrobiota bacterium]